MIIKNLAQFKRAIKDRTPFLIVKHYVHPESTGQVRVANVVQTNGFYSVVMHDEDNEINYVNGGKGSWMPYGKARENWMFEGETITAIATRYEWKTAGTLPYKYVYYEPIMTIKFIEKGDD